MKMNCEAVRSSTILGRMIYTKQALKLAFFAHNQKEREMGMLGEGRGGLKQGKRN